MRAVLSAAGGTRYAPLFDLLVNTGLRRGEALALQWSDVDLEAGTLRVRGTLARVNGKLEVTEPKTAKSKRTVPLVRAGRAVLRAVRLRASSGATQSRLLVAPDRVCVHHRLW